MESGHLLNSRGLVLSVFYTTVYRKEGTGAPSLNTNYRGFNGYSMKKTRVGRNCLYLQ